MAARFNKDLKKLYLGRLTLLVVLIITLLISLFSLLAINNISKYNLSPVASSSLVDIEKTEKPGLPKRLIISSINVDVNVDYVGLTSVGVMDIESNSRNAAWYMLGPRPGDKGSAVIAGHYGWGENNEPAIFNDINKLVKGDELSVIDQKGQSVIFVVREVRKYLPESDATFVFKANDNRAHLNLITCNGVWVDDKQSYSDRLVVFTDMKI